MIQVSMHEHIEQKHVIQLVEKDVQEVNETLSFLKGKPMKVETAQLYDVETTYGILSYYIEFTTNDGTYKFRQTDGNWSPLLTKLGTFQH